MTTQQQSERQKLQPLEPNHTLPTMFVDAVDVNMRTDGSILVRLSSSLPEGRSEMARFLMNSATINNVIDMLCRVTKHYPPLTAPEEQQKNGRPSGSLKSG